MTAEYIEIVLVVILIVVILLAMFMNNKRDAVLIGTTITNIAAIVMYIWLSKKYDALDEDIGRMAKDAGSSARVGKETFIGSTGAYSAETVDDGQCPVGGMGQYPGGSMGQYPGTGMQYPGEIEMQCPEEPPLSGVASYAGAVTGDHFGYAGAVGVNGAACDVSNNQYNVYDVASNVSTGDDKIAKYGLTRERNTRAISGSVERENLMAQFLVEETDEEDKKRWWGEDEQ